MLYIAITKHGQQFPRNIIVIERKAHLIQAIKDMVYSGRYDLADLPHNLNQPNVEQLLAIMDYLDGERHTKVTRQEYLRFHKERQS